MTLFAIFILVYPLGCFKINKRLSATGKFPVQTVDAMFKSLDDDFVNAGSSPPFAAVQPF
jgi:hypothetical protein